MATQAKDHRIVDQSAYHRAVALLLVEIPGHINECYQCRQGDRLIDAALKGKGPTEVDSEQFEAACREFCDVGQAMTTECGQQVYRAFALEPL